MAGQLPCQVHSNQLHWPALPCLLWWNGLLLPGCTPWGTLPPYAPGACQGAWRALMINLFQVLTRMSNYGVYLILLIDNCDFWLKQVLNHWCLIFGFCWFLYLFWEYCDVWLLWSLDIIDEVSWYWMNAMFLVEMFGYCIGGFWICECGFCELLENCIWCCCSWIL